MKGVVVVTGSAGFIGQNVILRLHEEGYETIGLTREHKAPDWRGALSRADVVVHLAGANRPDDTSEFERINVGTAQQLAECLRDARRNIPVIYASSVRAEGDDAYGASKRAGEQALSTLTDEIGADVFIYRLPNVFGKWARPNYNSAIATFCNNVARDLPIVIHDPLAPLRLVYIDDVVTAFLAAIEGKTKPGFAEVHPVYHTTVGAVANIIRGFRSDRKENLIGEVGAGLERALYATYVSALPPQEFSYEIDSHRDPRGAFSEMLKTRTSGQFSYFTAYPGVTRGGHYHHTKTEKFLVVQGTARFAFRNMISGETHEITTSGEVPTIVETVPGWTHDISNIGNDLLIAMLWANEIFDRSRPDTIAEKV